MLGAIIKRSFSNSRRVCQINLQAKIEIPVKKKTVKSKKIPVTPENVNTEGEIIKKKKTKSSKKQLIESTSTTVKTNDIHSNESATLLSEIACKEIEDVNSPNSEKCLKDTFSSNKIMQFDAIHFSDYNLTEYDVKQINEEVEHRWNNAINSHSTSSKSTKKDVKKGKIMREVSDQVSNVMAFTHFFQICMDTNNARIVKNILFSGSKHQFPIAAPINATLKSIYSNEDYTFFGELCEFLQANETVYNPETFALLFQCLGLFKNESNSLELTEYFLGLMKKKDVDLRVVFEERKFYNNCSHHATEAVARIDETLLNFTEKKKQKDRYNCVLLNSLNRTLCETNVDSTICDDIKKNTIIEGFKRQVEVEQSGVILVDAVHKYQNGLPNQTQLFEKWMKSWKEQLRAAFRIHKEILYDNFSKTDFKSFSFYPYFVCLDEDDYIEVMATVLQEMKSFKDGYSPTLRSLNMSAGLKVYNKYHRNDHEYQKIISHVSSAYETLANWYQNHSAEGGGYNPTMKWEEVLKKENSLEYIQTPKRYWCEATQRSIGETLMNLILNNATINVMRDGIEMTVRAFAKVFRYRDEHYVYEVAPCKELVQLSCSSDSIQYDAMTLPMLCPPLPWLSYKHGGYIMDRSTIFKSDVARSQLHLMETDKNGNLPILDGLTLLSAVPWRINKDILDVLLKVFRSGGWLEMAIPQDHDSFTATTPRPSGHFDSYVEKILKYTEYTKKKNENFSLWSDSLLKLSLANHFRDDIFWFSYNIDFRGRAYPTPAHLTHVTSDPYRALLYFAKGKPIGAKGLYWLKIHVANLTGLVKKLELSERVKFCEDNLEQIFDSADNPLDGNRWWAQGDDPWQALAACKELTKALRSESPEDYVSHLPIHQDGSCNGLQHYAALGRDTAGATAVNVKPGVGGPEDVYTHVLEMIMKRIKRDKENGLQVAMLVEPVINRKTIKQTVMTSVYGVTLLGAKLQIQKQLKEILIINESSLNLAARYVTGATFEALEEMFVSAKGIQNWLKNYASFISKIRDEQISWYTPLGLPIVQPYLKLSKSKELHPNIIKQRNAAPPNFIHSLDSTHMFLTTYYCSEKGITFGAIHDCFWTHAANVDDVNIICREQFANLYTQPILSDLKKYFDKKYVSGNYKGIMNISLPGTGDFDVNEVKSSTYFFS